jgi:uncharacterized SAM-binding protein YcdF (DUF218 family)
MTFIEPLADVVKATVPGSLMFLCEGLIVGVVLLYRGPRLARWGRRWLTALGLLYGMLGLPAVSNSLIRGLQAGYARLETRSDARGADVIAVIGAGVVSYEADGLVIHEMARRTAFSVLETVRVYQLTHPSWVIASGGIPNPISQAAPESEVIRDELVRLGVPCNRILMDSESRTTEEQIANIARILRERRLPGRLVMVMTPAHTRRIMLLAARQHIDAVPSVTTELRYDGGRQGWRMWIPSVDALRGSESALYEYLAFAKAWVQRRHE